MSGWPVMPPSGEARSAFCRRSRCADASHCGLYAKPRILRVLGRGAGASSRSGTRPGLAVERYDERIVGRFAWPAEVERRDDIAAAIALPDIDGRRDAAQRLNNREGTNLLSVEQLVVYEVHRSDIVRDTAVVRSYLSFALTRRFGVLFRDSRPISRYSRHTRLAFTFAPRRNSTWMRQ